jgi:hypothetical protein
MYENGNRKHVETVLRIRGEGNKGEWQGGKVNYDTLEELL